jgi:acetyltransferase-like isoleucine patch superfamily enzyme
MPDNERFQNWEYPKVEDGVLTKFNWLVQNVSGFKLGCYTDIGVFTYINARFGVIIKKNVQIGSHCSIYSVSTIDDKQGKVVLEENCKIGSHSTVMPGVTIGKNAVVGAHSFVTSDIPADAVAVGVPAKVIQPTRRRVTHSTDTDE